MHRLSVLLLVVGPLTACGESPPPSDTPTPDADTGPCRIYATELAGDPTTIAIFNPATSILRAETGTSQTARWSIETIGYGDTADFIAEASAVGLTTAVRRDIDDQAGGPQYHYDHDFDADGRLSRIEFALDDIFPESTVTTFTSHDDLDRPLTGTRTWSEDGLPDCNAIGVTFSYDDDARTVTEAHTAGLDPDNQPCRAPQVTVREYDVNVILIREDTWRDTTTPSGDPYTHKTYTVTTTAAVCPR